MAWEHISLTFRSQDLVTGKVLPFTTADQVQMDAVRDLQHAGFECIGVTTLADGALFLMFKRPAVPEAPAVDLEDRPELSIGQYL